MDKQQIKAEVDRIFEAGASKNSVFELIERLLPCWHSVDGSYLPEIGEKVLGRIRLGDHEFVEVMSIHSVTFLAGGMRSIDWRNSESYDPGIVQWCQIPAFLAETKGVGIENPVNNQI